MKCRRPAFEACKAAKAKSVTVSCDLNYRKKLWTRAEAGECMAKLLPYVDVCIANEEDAKDVFGIEAENTDIDSGKLDHVGYQRRAPNRAALRLQEGRHHSARLHLRQRQRLGRMLYDAKTDSAVFSTTYRVHIVDRVAAATASAAGSYTACSPARTTRRP